MPAAGGSRFAVSWRAPGPHPAPGLPVGRVGEAGVAEAGHAALAPPSGPSTGWVSRAACPRAPAPRPSSWRIERVPAVGGPGPWARGLEASSPHPCPHPPPTRPPHPPTNPSPQPLHAPHVSALPPCLQEDVKLVQLVQVRSQPAAARPAPASALPCAPSRLPRAVGAAHNNRAPPGGPGASTVHIQLLGMLIKAPMPIPCCCRRMGRRTGA